MIRMSNHQVFYWPYVPSSTTANCRKLFSKSKAVTTFCIAPFFSSALSFPCTHSYQAPSSLRLAASPQFALRSHSLVSHIPTVPHRNPLVYMYWLPSQSTKTSLLCRTILNLFLSSPLEFAARTPLPLDSSLMRTYSLRIGRSFCSHALFHHRPIVCVTSVVADIPLTLAFSSSAPTLSVSTHILHCDMRLSALKPTSSTSRSYGSLSTSLNASVACSLARAYRHLQPVSHPILDSQLPAAYSECSPARLHSTLNFPILVFSPLLHLPPTSQQRPVFSCSLPSSEIPVRLPLCSVSMPHGASKGTTCVTAPTVAFLSVDVLRNDDHTACCSLASVSYPEKSISAGLVRFFCSSAPQQRRVIGHRVEIFKGKHRRRRRIPPRIPLHPLAQQQSKGLPSTAAAAAQDMSLFETYRDLQLRWKKTCKQRKKKYTLARKWRMPRNIRPLPACQWTLVFHVNPAAAAYNLHSENKQQQHSSLNAVSDMASLSAAEIVDEGAADGGSDEAGEHKDGSALAGAHAEGFEKDSVLPGGPTKKIVCETGEAHREKARERLQKLLLLQHQFPRYHAFCDQSGSASSSGDARRDTDNASSAQLPSWLCFLSDTPPEEVFCVFKSNVSTQHKVTAGDLIQAEKLHRKQAGDQVVFGTVLLVGSKHWTIIGKPTIPFAKVEATVEEQTLTGEQLTFFYRKSRRISRFLRIRHWVTMLRIDRIVIESQAIDEGIPRPERLLDLWANRLLYPEEREGIERGEDGKPVAEEIYDGKENQRGLYQKKGLTPLYRWYPDPRATHWRPFIQVAM